VENLTQTMATLISYTYHFDNRRTMKKRKGVGAKGMPPAIRTKFDEVEELTEEGGA